MSHNVIAIDPGAVSGAIAVFFGAGGQSVGDLAIVNGQVDAAALSRMVRLAAPCVAIVEDVHSMPKQGVSSTFKFGVAVGIIRGVLVAYGVPLYYVAPTVWKKHFGLIGPDKEKSRALALQRYPALAESLGLKKHQNRAEALLLGEWFLATNKGQRP